MSLKQFILRSCLGVLGIFPAVTRAQQSELVIRAQDRNTWSTKTHPVQTADVRTVILEGSFSDRRMRRILSGLRQFPLLSELRFTGHTMEFVPREVMSFPALRTLVIAHSDELDVDSLLLMGAAMPDLRTLAVGIQSAQMAPLVPTTVQGFDTLILVGPAIPLDASAPWPPVLPDDYSRTVHMEEIRRKWERSELLPVVYLLPKDTELRAGMGSSTQSPEGYRSSPVSWFRHLQMSDSGIAMRSGPDQHIAPPVPALHPTAGEVVVPPDEASVVNCGRYGTQLIIPADAFTDRNGLLLKEPVTLRYTELRDPVDFIFSGIPMSFPNEQGMSYFRSAGMFELRASAKGEEVFLREDTDIQIRFASTSPGDEFVFWKLDEDTGEWTQEGQAPEEIAPVQEELPRLTRAETKFQKELIRLDRYSDPTPLDERFNSPDYTYTRKERKEKMVKVKAGDSMRRLDKLIRIRKIRRAGPDRQLVFEIDYVRNLHPEMTAFRGARWILPDQPDLRSFRKQYGGRNGYSDIRIAPSGEGVEIQLKTDTGLVAIQAKPAKITGTGRRAEIKEFGDRYPIYERQLHKREKIFAKRALKNLNAGDRIPVRDTRWRNELCYKRVRRSMNHEERALTPEQWMDRYYEKRRAFVRVMAGRPADGNGVYRMLSVSGFGIFNCDQMSRLQDPVLASVTYTDKGELVRVETAYLVSVSANAVVTYHNAFGLNPGNMFISPADTDYLVLVHPDKSVSLVGKEAINSQPIRETGKACFEIQRFPSSPATLDEVRNAIGS